MSDDLPAYRFRVEPFQRAELERRMWEWRVDGMSVNAISAKLITEGWEDYTPAYCRRVLMYLLKNAQEHLKESIITEAARQYHALDKIHREAMEAWKDSKGSGDDIRKPEARYLTEARGALADIRALLGINTPTKLGGGNTTTNTAILFGGDAGEQMAGFLQGMTADLLERAVKETIGELPPASNALSAHGNGEVIEATIVPDNVPLGGSAEGED